MDDARATQVNTFETGKRVVFEGVVYDMPLDFNESKKPRCSMRTTTLPHYYDGTPFPANWFSHETVVGYPSDKSPENDGVDDVLDMVSLFEGEDLRCYIHGVVALQYYGSERVRHDWWICVPTPALSKAVDLLKARPEKYTPFAPDCRVADEPLSKWPRFKVAGTKLFVLLVAADEVRFAIDPEGSIVRGKTGLPFPSLPAFVQSLLDSKNLLDLEDIIDAMNLGEDWAAGNSVEVSDQPYPGVRMSPKQAWEKSTRTRQSRMGWKYDPKIYATRYRRYKERDPRETGDL